jgi:large subunit ribosomal protein L22
MEAIAIQKFIHSTPRKLRLVADMVRKSEPNKALEILHFTNKVAATDLAKAIETALANSKQKGMDGVYFKAIEINEGPKMRRFRAGSKGRVRPYKRRMAHIRIILTDDLKLKNQMSNVKNDEEVKIQNETVEKKAPRKRATKKETK